MRESKKYRVRHGVTRASHSLRRGMLFLMIFAVVLVAVCVAMF